MEVSPQTTVSQFRHFLNEKTGVAVEDQKIMGFVGKPKDEDLLGVAVKSLAAGGKAKLSLIGQPKDIMDVRRKEVSALQAQAKQEEEERLRAEAALQRMRVAQEEAAQRERERQNAEMEERNRQRRIEAERMRLEAANNNHGYDGDGDDDNDNADPRLARSASFDLVCHSVAFAGASTNKRAIEDWGDKISLPPSVLQQLIETRVRMPVTFRVTCPRTNQTTHCGVAEFNAPDGVCVIPQWMMRALQVDEGATLHFESKHLPKGEAVTLRPHRAGWMSLNQSDAGQSMLTDQFSRHFTTLTAGQTIDLVAADRGLYSFDVVNVTPDGEGAISLLETDLALELLPALESDNVPSLALDTQVRGHVSQDQTMHFALLVGPHDRLVVRVTPAEGSTTSDPDLFASFASRTPSRSDFELCAVSKGESELQVQGDGHAARTLVIGVTSYTKESSFVLVATTALPPPAGMNLNNNNNNESGGVGETCQNCRKFIQSSAQLHFIRCKQLVWYCEDCAMPMSIDSKEKHVAVLHQLVACSCGTQVPLRLMPVHKSVECLNRHVKCIYCAVSITEGERPEHSGLCGHKRARCAHCPVEGKRNEMQKHVQETHGIWKPLPTKDWLLE